MRRVSSLVVCLPGVLLGLWYAWSAFARFDQYRRSAGQDVELTWEAFQLQLFDVLRSDLRRVVLPAAPENPGVEHLALHVDAEGLRLLSAGAALESARPYVAAKLDPGDLGKGETLIPVEIRLRGQRHWHLLGKQKSIKVRLPKGRLHNGYRVFNLINDPDPMVVGEEVILGLLREQGVLTPFSDFARLRMNTTDLGVFRYVTQPEESVLRNGRRIPGNIYSGDLPPSSATEELWADGSQWKKVASRDGSEEEERDRADIDRLLGMITSATIAEFADFVRREVDIRPFAVFDALDVAFACDQHDYRENHKLYFDPYRGRWEPIAWNFKGFRDDPAFDVVENPLLLRLKMVPEYLALRNTILYDFLTGAGSPSAVRARGVELLRKLAPELATDPNWDASGLLPDTDRFSRQMVRPMDLRRALLVFESKMAAYGRRHDLLVRELEGNPLWLHASGQDREGRTGIQVVIDGRVGVSLEAFRAQWPAGCAPRGWQVFRDGRPVTEPSSGEVAELIRPETLLPTVRIAARERPDPAAGGVVSEMAPVSYAYTLAASCAPEGIVAEGRHLATGSRLRSRAASAGLLAAARGSNLAPGDRPRFLPGETGPRPRVLPPPAETVTLGPGTVAIPETRIFAEHETVRIAPGTTILMGKGASLVFLGRLRAEGSRTDPVVIRGAGEAAWGGIALLGRGSAGSTLDHTLLSGGTVPTWRLAVFPGMVNFHDTANLALRNVVLSGNEGRGDMLHAAYVDGLAVEDLTVRDAARDALDLEFVRGTLRRVEVAGAGDDGLDLMGVELEFADGVISRCRGNGVSAGEESRVTIRNSLVASSGVGVLVKNAADAYLFSSLLYRNGTGVEAYRRTVRFGGDSTIAADVLFVVDSAGKPVRRKDRKADLLDRGRIQTLLPQRKILRSLREDVLGLGGWEELPAWLSARREGAAR